MSKLTTTTTGTKPTMWEQIYSMILLAIAVGLCIICPFLIVLGIAYFNRGSFNKEAESGNN